MSLRIIPCTVKGALRQVKAWHRHLPDLQGGLFAAMVAMGPEVVGVGVAGNPAQEWQGTGRITISRVATNEARNACSKLYGALCRAAQKDAPPPRPRATTAAELIRLCEEEAAPRLAARAERKAKAEAKKAAKAARKVKAA